MAGLEDEGLHPWSALPMRYLEMLFCTDGALSRGGYYERMGPLPLRSVYFAINQEEERPLLNLLLAGLKFKRPLPRRSTLPKEYKKIPGL